MVIAKSIKLALLEANMKQLKLASLIGVHPNLISRWASGYHISPAKLNDVCKALGYTVSQFIALGE